MHGDTMLPNVSLPMANPARPGHDDGRGTGRRAAGALARLPGVAGLAAVPDVTHRQRTQGQLGDEHGPGLLEPEGDGGLLLKHLVLEGSAPHVVG